MYIVQLRQAFGAVKKKKKSPDDTVVPPSKI